MYLNIIGAAALIAAGVFTGKTALALLSRKGRVLREVKDTITCIQSNFRYRGNDTLAAFNEAAKLENIVFDIDVSGMSATEFKQQLSTRIVSAQNTNILLNDEQKRMLKEALMCIGSGNVNEECDRLEFYINYFETEYKKAYEFEQRNKRLFLALSAYVSLVVVIVLI